MKTNLNLNTLRRLVMALAAVTVGLRFLMYFVAVDEKGLLTPWNLPGILVTLITAAAVAVVVVGYRRLTDAGENPVLVNDWIYGCALAVGIVVVLLTGTSRGDGLAKARYWLGWASVPCLLTATLALHMGKRPFFAFHGIVCLFFGLNLVDSYRLWSGEPQLMDYVFQLFGCVGLLLTSYQRTAFDVDLGSIRALRITELLTAFACLVAAPESGQQALFYLAGGMWCLAGLHAPALPEVTDDEYT